MKRLSLFVLWLIFLNAEVEAVEPKAKGSLEYSVSMPNPGTHYFEVKIQLKNFDKDHVDFSMPVWTPGSYLIREYAKNIEGFKAMDGVNKKDIKSYKINKNTWRVEHNKEALVVIRYLVYAFEGSVRMSYLDENHGFIMANTLLMYVEDLRSSSSVLRLNFPDKWKNVSTSLSRIEGNSNSFYIPDYDILVDSPIEIGNHDILKFTAAGVPHEVAMYGAASYNKERIKRDLTSIVESATSIFEENPNEKYTFIVHHSDNGGGGLEHLSSTVLGVSRWAYGTEMSYQHFLSLAAHEYFHLWLVKRLKPVEFETLDYNKEVYTDLLWLMEGVTSYFEEKIMHRGGFYSDGKFISNLLSAMAGIRNIPGSQVQSVADASFDAWIKFYRWTENSDNSQISYYDKGMVLGALLDLEIIQGSQGEKSLDNVINQLYYQFYKKKGKGITSKDLQKAAEKASGKDLDNFFNDYIYGTKDLANEKYLHFAGIGLIETNSVINSKSIGINFEHGNASLIISGIIHGGSAFENGLNVGDELISIEEYRITPDNFSSIINQYKAGDRITILLSRKGIVLEKELDVRKNESVSYTYEILSNQTKQQEKVYKTWLGK